MISRSRHFLNRTSASDDEALPEIRVETSDKINYWRDKLDQTPKLEKRKVFECAAPDLFLEAECEHDLGAVQAIRDAIYVLGRDHAGLDDDSIEWIIAGGRAKAERPINGPASRDAVDEPPPVTSTEELRHAANEEIKKPAILRPTPFKYRPAIEIPKRAWLYGRHYLRGCATATIAPPGFTKSCRSLTELIIMALKRPLLGEAPTAEGPLTVLALERRR